MAVSDEPEHQGFPERVSSSWTFFYKFVFTTVWSGFFGIPMILMFVSPSHEVRAQGLAFAAVGLVFSVFLWGTCGCFKRVRLDGTTLLISNYRKEIRVSTEEIAAVKQNRLINLRPVIVTFKRETPFGYTVTFMPRVSFRIFSEDEIVARLRRAQHPGGSSEA